MQRLFNPRSIAVIGVSEDEDKFSTQLLRNLLDHEYQGSLYAIGARQGRVHDQQIYASLTDVPSDIDLAAILTPAATLPSLLQQCGKRGITRAVIMTAGFTEYGAEREELERRMVDAAREYGIRFIGPNCVGIINMDINMVCVFNPINKGAIHRGPISVLAQSGTVAMMSALSLCQDGIGVSKVASIGNKLNVDEVDLLPYLNEDEHTRVAALYLEGIKRGRALFDVIRSMDKPVAVQKAGVGEFGSRAARSHTASIATDDRVVTAALSQAAATHVRRVPDLLAAAKALLLPPMQGDRIGIIGSSGGAAVTGADASGYQGLSVPKLPQWLADDLEAHSPAKLIRKDNPVDLGDVFDMQVYIRASEAICNLPDIDGMLGVLMFPPRGKYGSDLLPLTRHLHELGSRSGKPIAVVGNIDIASMAALRKETSVPIFGFAEEGVEALAMGRAYARRLALRSEIAPELPVDRARVRAILRQAVAEDRRYLGEEAMGVLDAYGIKSVPSRTAATLDGTVAAAEKLGYPLVLKVRSRDIVHKSDVGGVVTGIQSAGELRDAYQAMIGTIGERQPGARLEGVVLQRMVQAGREMIVGGRRDANFGPVVMVGMGGLLVEVLDDVSLRLAPLGPKQAGQMVSELRGAKLLSGVRGSAPRDVSSLIDVLLRVGQLLVDFPEITECDINPLKVLDDGQGSVAVDARLALS